MILLTDPCCVKTGLAGEHQTCFNLEQDRSSDHRNEDGTSAGIHSPAKHPGAGKESKLTDTKNR